MDFIHTSWNSKLSPAEFQQLFSEQSDKLFIVIKIFDLIGHFSGKERVSLDDFFFQDIDESQFFILYDFLFVSLNTSPELFIDSVIDSSSTSQKDINRNLSKLGLVRFLSKYGNQLFENYNDSQFKIDLKKYSLCCLIVLQICISFGFDEYSLSYDDFTTNDKNYLNSYEFYISEIAISKISSSISFNIIIAQSRLYFKTEIINTRKMLEKRILLTSRKLEQTEENQESFNFFDEEKFSLNLSENYKSEVFLISNGLNEWKQLKHIILSDRTFIETKISLLPRCEIFLYVVSDLLIIRNNPCLFEYSRIENIYGTYMHVISQNLSTPSLYLGYMIAAFFVQYLTLFENHSLKSTNSEILSAYSRSNFNIIFDHIKKISEEATNDQKFSSFFSDHRCYILDFISNYDELKSYLSTMPKINDKIFEIFYETIYNYPAFSSMAIPSFLEFLEKDDVETCAQISRQILQNYERIQDFRIFIYKRGSFFELIAQLFRLSTIITDEELFQPIWSLALTLVRFTWGSGSVGIYERFVIFVDSFEPLPIRYVLRFLLQIEPQKDDLIMTRESKYLIDDKPEKADDFFGFSKFYPFYIVARTLNYLLLGKYQLDQVCSFVSDHPCLCLSALLYCYSRPTEENKMIIIKLKQPNDELIKLVFKQVMLRMMEKKSKKWEIASEMNDLMIMRENPPNSPNEMIAILSNNIQAFSTPISLRFSKIISVSNIWLALSEHFGFEVFTRVFLHEIIKTMYYMEKYLGFDNLDIKPSSSNKMTSFINSIGHAFAVFINYQSGKLKIMINLMIEIANSEIESFHNADMACSFAQLALILINDSVENWKEAFNILFERCKATLQECIKISPKKKIGLALSFIRIALIIPKLRDLVINDNLIIQILLDLHDCSTIIDLIIAKDMSINNQNS